jgi:RNA polymerase sigma-70 factor, ECF subfamily
MEVAVIYSQFHRSLLSFIRSRIRSKEDAEDILQNVFIRISANVDKLSEDEKLKAWIFTITKNAIIDYYRANASKRKITAEEEIDENVRDVSESDATQGLEQCISSMIGLLPSEYRDIIIDSELKGIRQKDLADKYGMPYPSLRARVQRGRERLKQLFYNCCHIETDSRGNVLEAKGRSDCNAPCNPCSGKEESIL